MTSDPVSDPACDLAHGLPADETANPTGTVVAVFASPVADHLLHFAAHLGWRGVLFDPDSSRLRPRLGGAARTESIDRLDGVDLTDADVVVTDHDRAELGAVLLAALAGEARWVGVMGSRRHAPPHVPALQDLGVADEAIARVHRPIGLDIGSRASAEIALSTMAGLLANRRGRAGGFGST